MENKKIADIIIKQIHLFFISGLYGILLGLWYEFFRTLRKNFVHKNKMVHLEDVIFCFTAAIGLFILFQVYNQGMVRFYCLVGLECGAVFYFLVLSEVIGKLFSVFIKIISKIVKITGGIILFPGKVIVKNTGKITGIFKFWVDEFRKKWQANRRKLRSIKKGNSYGTACNQ